MIVPFLLLLIVKMKYEASFHVDFLRCIITGLTDPNQTKKAKAAIEWIIKRIDFDLETNSEGFYNALEVGLKNWPRPGTFECVFGGECCARSLLS